MPDVHQDTLAVSHGLLAFALLTVSSVTCVPPVTVAAHALWMSWRMTSSATRASVCDWNRRLSCASVFAPDVKTVTSAPTTSPRIAIDTSNSLSVVPRSQWRSLRPRFRALLQTVTGLTDGGSEQDDVAETPRKGERRVVSGGGPRAGRRSSPRR